MAIDTTLQGTSSRVFTSTTRWMLKVSRSENGPHARQNDEGDIRNMNENHRKDKERTINGIKGKLMDGDVQTKRIMVWRSEEPWDVIE